MRYRFETDSMNLTEIGVGKLTEINHVEICAHARFILDKPIYCTSNDVLELIDGQWYLIVGDEHIRLQGRWVDLR